MGLLQRAIIWQPPSKSEVTLKDVKGAVKAYYKRFDTLPNTCQVHEDIWQRWSKRGCRKVSLKLPRGKILKIVGSQLIAYKSICHVGEVQK